MTTNSLLENISQLIGAIESRIRAFADSDEFYDFCKRTASWIKSRLRWIAGAIV